MRRPSRLSLIIAGGLLAICAIPVVVAVAVVSLGGGTDSPPAQPRFRGSPAAVRQLAPDFALRDALTGELVRMGDQRGRVVLLTFLESRCTTACPLIASQVGAALRRLPPEARRQVSAIAVSANPDDDTPASVRAFLARHRALGQIRYLNRPRTELARVWGAYQVLSASESGDADTHSAPVRIYGRDGRWLATLHPGADLSADNLAHDLTVALGR